MSKKSILFVNGIGDDSSLEVRSINEEGLHMPTYSGSANIYNYFHSDLCDKVMITLDTDLNQRITTGAPDMIFNQISDADTHKAALFKMDYIYKEYAGKIPFLNPPENIKKTTRDSVYQLLQGIDKLNIPKTVKIEPKLPSDIYESIEKEHFKFPVIIREVDQHDDIGTLLVVDNKEQFHALALDGRAYYLTQFSNYHLNGLYRKEQLVVVNGEVFIGDVQFSDNWLVDGQSQLHSTDTSTMKKSIAKRFESDIKPIIQPIITEIYSRLGLDYFKIDCHITQDNKLLVFNINANMDVFNKVKTDIFIDQINMIHKNLTNMVEEKFNT